MLGCLRQVGSADTQPSGQQADTPSCPEVKWITVSQSALPLPPQGCFSTARGHLPCGCDLWPQPPAPPPGSEVEDWRMPAVLSGNGWWHSSIRALGERKKKWKRSVSNKVKGLCLSKWKETWGHKRDLLQCAIKARKKDTLLYIFMSRSYRAPCRKLERCIKNFISSKVQWIIWSGRADWPKRAFSKWADLFEMSLKLSPRHI